MRVRMIRWLLPRVQTITRSLRRVILILGGRDSGIACRDIHAEDGTVEDTVGGLGLVRGDFVASLEDAGEGEVAVLTDEAAGVGGICVNRSVAGRVEG